MTVSSTTRKAGPFAGTGSAVPYPFAFKIFLSADVLVVKTTSAGDTSLTLTTHYTVTPNADQDANPGGAVNLVTPLAVGESLTLSSRVSPLQQLDLQAGGGFYPQAIEDALDRLTILLQQFALVQAGTVQLAISTPSGVSTLLPPPVANRLIGWDPAGTALVNQDPASIVTDNTAGLRAFYATPAGAGAIGILDAAGLTLAANIEAALRELMWTRSTRIHFFDFVTDPAIRAGIIAGTNTTDLATSFANFRAALVARPLTARTTGYLPNGLYTYSASPNWAIDGLTIVSDGARLRNTGTGPAVLVDAIAGLPVTFTANYCYGVKWLGRTYVEGATTTGESVLLRSVHHSDFHGFNLKGNGAGLAAVRTRFAVCTNFHQLMISGNETGWFAGVAPAVGVLLEAYVVGGDAGHTSYCTFNQPVIEGVVLGVNLSGTLGNNFDGGTIEGCTGGVLGSADSSHDKFNGVDLEVNSAYDFLLGGKGTSLNNVETDTKISVSSGGFDIRINGGYHSAIEFQSGSHDCIARGAIYDRKTIGATVTDAGTYNGFPDCRKFNSPFRGRPVAPTAVSVTASPMTITNGTGDDQVYELTGGTISSIFHGRRGTSSAALTYYPGSEFILKTGESLVITYSAAPTITAWK